MVLRDDGAGVLAIGQASHAWICGQLARAWGNARFGAVAPLAEVALGAEQHDVGMAAWDLHPTRNPDTGRPRSFLELAPTVSARLWEQGPTRLRSQSRYAALLAAMHGRRLFQPRAGVELASATVLARNHALVWTWDTLSLALLLDWSPLTLEQVPAVGEDPLAVTVTPATGGVTLAPWPFRDPGGVRVHCEGRRLRETYDSDEALAVALDAARWETVAFELTPA